MSDLAYATADITVILPIIDKVQGCLVGEDFEASVIALMMLLIVMQRQDLDPDEVQGIVDEWSKSLHQLFALHDFQPPTKDLKLN